MRGIYKKSLEYQLHIFKTSHFIVVQMSSLGIWYTKVLK